METNMHTNSSSKINNIVIKNINDRENDRFL